MRLLILGATKSGKSSFANEVVRACYQIEYDVVLAGPKPSVPMLASGQD